LARPLDTEASARILSAALELLGDVGYGKLTLSAVAARAEVGKPAIYRRYSGKRELVVAAIDSMLPGTLAPATGDPRKRIRAAFMALTAADLERYVGLVGELLNLSETEPELIAAWRRAVLEPRRQQVLEIVRDAQRDGVIDTRMDPDFVVDQITAQILARVWQGRPVDDAWRRRTWKNLQTAITFR
jgi:AcrR family transcriptional regulator